MSQDNPTSIRNSNEDDSKRMCLLIIKVERTKSNKLVYIKNDQLSDRHKQATVKMLDYTGYTIANKTERSKPGYHDF